MEGDQPEAFRALRRVAAQSVSYSVPSVDPSEQSYTSDGDWNGGEAEASYPNPSEDPDVVDELGDNYLLVPTSSDHRDNKGLYKLPYRVSHQGAVHEDALVAIIQAINGARGGVEGVSSDALEDAYDAAVAMAVEAGVYEERDDAPDFEAETHEAEASLSIEFGRVEASADGAGLTGKIWGAGIHSLWVNGEPAEVKVPADTVPDTYDDLAAKVDSDDPPVIGTDHFDAEDVPVAADADLLTVGEMREVDLRDDAIHLTESAFTNQQAVEAAESGAFDGAEFSIVGDMKFAFDDEGEVQTTEDDAFVVAEAKVDKVDIVQTGAVDGTQVSVNVTDAAIAARRVAAERPKRAAGLLRVAAKHATMEDDFDPSDYDDLEAALSEFEDVVAERDDKIEALQSDVDELEGELNEKTDALASIAASQGIDWEDDEVEAQDVIDAFTEDIRRDIAAKEDALPTHATGTEDGPSIDERAEDLAGKSVSALKAQQGDLANQLLENTEAREQYSAARAADDTGGSGGSGGSGGYDGEVDDLALNALAAGDMLAARKHEDGPAAFVEAEFDVDPSEHSDPDDLRDAIHAAKVEAGGD